jgi:thiamine pyrophosphate-dependent acetolactate synthase large subunit-like protein
MRELVSRYLSDGLSRRDFLDGLTKTGITLAAAESVVNAVSSVAVAQTPLPAGGTGVNKLKQFQGTGGEAFAEQLIASGVKYIFGNSASEDAPFYDALVDRPQLTYILTPHEGPGAAMAAGYIKASNEPAICMQAGAVGLCNAMGQMLNAYKEQTPLVFYAYRSDSSTRAGRDGFEEVMYQEQMVQPLTKYSWLARRPDRIAETVRRAFRSSWTAPYGPSYVSWHTDYTHARVTTDIVSQEQIDPDMRVRANPREIERAAKLLVEARMPVMIVGDEIYKTRSVDKAVKLAEMLGMAVTQARQLFANFPETHPLWVGNLPGGTMNSLAYPRDADVVINVGNKMQHNGPQPIVGRSAKFIDMRLDPGSIGIAINTEVPMVADVAFGLDDLTQAVQQLLTASIKQKAAERTTEIRKFTEQAKVIRGQIVNSPEWNNSPLISDRVTFEVARFADPNAIVIHEAGSVALHHFDFNPVGGRELFFYYGSHLGSGVGTAAGVKLARPKQQVICLVGDGSFIFGPTALWNMARLELPVITVVYNNHAYSGPHSRAISGMPEGRMVQTNKFMFDYLGNPDMNMAAIAAGFGVKGEQVSSPGELQAALARAKAMAAEGKPYLIDAQIARRGVGWVDKPWVPTIQVADLGQKKI